ncbi:hypothetical protein DFH09DRAFT_890084, partial [Mycena vulgaris]
VSRIEHLHELLASLPASLPLDPTHSLYRFELDPERLKDGGHFAAVGHALEISFQTHLLKVQDRPILFVERGARLDALVKMLKIGVKRMSPGERSTFQAAWLERLITAALDSGAKIPSKKRKDPPADAATSLLPPPKKTRGPIITVDDSDDDAAANMSASTLPPIPDTSTSTPFSSSSARTVVGNPQQRTLGSLGWKKATPEDVAAYWVNAKAVGSERREAVLATEAKKAADKKQHEKDLARLRKQRQREREKAEREDEEPDIADQHNANTVLLQGADALAHGSKAIAGVADLSRSTTQAWKKHRNGTQSGAVQGPSKKVFWFTPFLWAIIEPTIRRCGWSAARTVKELHRAHPNLFNGPKHKLHRATLWKWIVKGEKRFSDAALRSISNRRSLGGTGRVGVLTPHPEIVQEIVTHHLRQSQLNYLVRCHQQQLAAGITPENVRFSSSYPVLRNASVRACVELYDWLTGPDGREIVKRSWELCIIPGKPQYNLSYECLTSRETRKALRKYLQQDTILPAEIRARLTPSDEPPTTPADAGITPGSEITDGDDVPPGEQDQEA